MVTDSTSFSAIGSSRGAWGNVGSRMYVVQLSFMRKPKDVALKSWHIFDSMQRCLVGREVMAFTLQLVGLVQKGNVPTGRPIYASRAETECIKEIVNVNLSSMNISEIETHQRIQKLRIPSICTLSVKARRKPFLLSVSARMLLCFVRPLAVNRQRQHCFLPRQFDINSFGETIRPPQCSSCSHQISHY
jgi:hypothetical protein